MDPFILQAVVTSTGMDKYARLVGAILLDLTRSWVEHVVCELTGLERYPNGKTRYWDWFGSANSMKQKEWREQSVVLGYVMTRQAKPEKKTS
jgi:hypothetical protein